MHGEGRRGRRITFYLSCCQLFCPDTACKSAEMTFKELFNHLARFLHNPEQRWKHVVRVKRGLQDPNDIGGYGKDQCYFEGKCNEK